MKRILLVILLVLLIALLAAGIFILTFDANRYRPLIAQKIEEASGRPAEIGKIGFSWHDGLALAVSDLVIYEAAGSKAEWARLDSVAVLLNLKALLQKEIEFSSIVVEKPSFTLVNKPRTPALIEGRPVQDQGASPQVSGAAAAAPLAFIIKSIKINDGTFRFVDPAPQNPLALQMDNIDVQLKNFAMNQQVNVSAQAAAFSEKQNLETEGKVLLLPSGGVSALDFKTALDLATVDPARLMAAVPALQKIGIARGMRGQALLRLPELRVLNGKVEGLQGEFNLQEGWIKTGTLSEPVEDLTVAAIVDMEQGTIRVPTVSGRIGTASFGATGQMDNFKSPLARTDLRGTVSGIDLAKNFPGESGKPSLEGLASASFQGAAQGNAAPLLTRSLAATANLSLRDGVIRNFNLLREVFSKLSMIPGAAQNLERNLPEGYNDKLKARDTFLEPVEIPVSIQNGAAFWNRALLRSDSFEIVSSGRASFTGDVLGEAMLTIDRNFSEAAVASVPELQYLTSRDGSIQIPLVIRKNGPEKLSITPDLQYIGSRLALATVGGLFQKKNTAPATDPSASYPAADSEQGAQYVPPYSTGKGLKGIKGKDLLGQLLQGAIQNQGSQDSSSSGQ